MGKRVELIESLLDEIGLDIDREEMLRYMLDSITYRTIVDSQFECHTSRKMPYPNIDVNERLQIRYTPKVPGSKVMCMIFEVIE